MENEKRTRPHANGVIKYTKGYTKKMFFNKMIQFFITLIIFAIVATVIFVYVKQPVKTAEGYLTAEPAYDIMEHGQKVLVVEGEKTNFLTPLARFLFEQDAYHGKVIAGPYGAIQQVNGGYRVDDGTNVISVNVENPPEYLDFQYIVKKIDSQGLEVEGLPDVVLTKKEILGKIIE